MSERDVVRQRTEQQAKMSNKDITAMVRIYSLLSVITLSIHSNFACRSVYRSKKRVARHESEWWEKTKVPSLESKNHQSETKTKMKECSNG